MTMKQRDSYVSNYSWQIVKELEELFSGIRVTKRSLNRIAQEWGEEAREVVEENPFQLVEEIDGIGFATADALARKLGFARDGMPRIRAGVVHTLKDVAFSKGHVCLPEGTLAMKVEELLGLGREEILRGVESLIYDAKLSRDGDYVYLASAFRDERIIAEKIKALMGGEFDGAGIEPDMTGLAEDQIEALKLAFSSGVFILTGAPGTGKTFTIKRIIEAFQKETRWVALAAPTGKAAKRMFEQSGYPAKTIHRLLEVQGGPGGFTFTRNRGNMLDSDLIILDEVSMIDNSLMARLLDAVQEGTRLILVGDTYQLPSIGPGNILKDLMESGRVPFRELTIIKRQNPGLIIRNCHAVKNGEDIEEETEEGQKTDFRFISIDEEKGIQDRIFDLVARTLPADFHEPLRDVQVIVPFRERTLLSCKALNERFQKEMNPSPFIDKCGFKLGDKVIQLRNDYEREILNGDIGFVKSINMKLKKMMIQFEGKEGETELHVYNNDLTLAYAITCHRFQGSEAKVIVIPIHRCFGGFVQRNWLYTAVSRARELCAIVGQREETRRIIGRNQTQSRWTRLQALLVTEASK